MKAVTLKAFGGVDNFLWETVETPTNPPGNVLVRIKATAFNPIDYQMRQGSPESKLLASAILGREMAGVVAEVGAEVTGFSVGDEVAAYVGSLGSNGTYTEYVSIPAELLARKPHNISFEEAAATPMVGLTALQCFERLPLTPADSIFVAGGAGGVGTMLIKLLLTHGFHQVITTAGNEASKAHLLALGIQERNVLDYKQPELVQTLLALNHDRPFDICIDLVGGEMSTLCSEVIKLNGTYADITFLATPQAREQLFDKGTTVLHVSNYAYALSRNKADFSIYGQKLQFLFDLMQEGKLTGPPVHVVGDLSLESVQKAHLMLEKNQTNGQKLVMRVPS